MRKAVVFTFTSTLYPNAWLLTLCIQRIPDRYLSRKTKRWLLRPIGWKHSLDDYEMFVSLIPPALQFAQWCLQALTSSSSRYFSLLHFNLWLRGLFFFFLIQLIYDYLRNPTLPQIFVSKISLGNPHNRRPCAIPPCIPQWVPWAPPSLREDVNIQYLK